MKKYIGSYKNIYICQSKDEKILKKSSSGGFVTSSLIYALKNKIVDAAIVVSMNKEKPWKYEVALAKTQKDIISAAGSKYTIIPLNEFLNIAEKNKKLNLAMVGLPCHITAIRQLQKKGLYKNIKLLIGLFCGYNMPFEATEFLIKKSKIRRNQIKHLKYRGSDYPGGFLIKTKQKLSFLPKTYQQYPEGHTTISNQKHYFLPKGYYDFLNLMFVPKGCLRCKDYTNELADISVGDAWNWDNSSVVIQRTELGNNLLSNPLVISKKIDEKEFYRMHWHNIKHKKIGDPLTLKAIMLFIKIFGRIIPFRIISLIVKRITRTKRRWSLKDVGEHWDRTNDYDEINKETYSYFRRFTDGYKLSDIKDNAYVLEYCTRTGNGALYFAGKRKNLRFVCMDVSEKMLKIADENLKSKGINFKTILTRTTWFPIKDNMFDNILCFETLEHLPHPELTVKELARVTKPKGEVLITMPNTLWEFVHWFAAVTGIHHSEGPHLFIPRKKMIVYIKNAGLKIKREETTVLIAFGPKFLVRLGELLERIFKNSLMKYIGLRRIFVCEKI